MAEIKADDKGLIAKTIYASHEKADEVYQYQLEGFPLADSIGFIPLSVIHKDKFDSIDKKALGIEDQDLSGVDRIYDKWLMLEYSKVPIPSNPDALQLSISKGWITEENKDPVEKHRTFGLAIASTIITGGQILIGAIAAGIGRPEIIEWLKVTFPETMILTTMTWTFYFKS